MSSIVVINRFEIYVLAVAACVCAACGTDTRSEDDGEQVDGRVQRLSETFEAGWRGPAGVPLAIPLDGHWQPSQCHIERVDEGIVLTPDGAPPTIFRACNVNLGQYTHLRVRMKTDGGRCGTLLWQGSYKPRLEDAPNSTVPLFADDTWRDYNFPLYSPESGPWRGQITGLALVPSDAAATVAVGAVTFVALPPEGPLRITLGDGTREALYGASLQWKLTVPPHGVLEAPFGMAAVPSAVSDSDGVRFTVKLQREGRKPMPLLNERLQPPHEGGPIGWVDHEVDLSDYAGQEVAIEFKIDSLKTQCHDFAFWGDPIVYSRAKLQTGTPVVLISCDTMRADHLSCYGYARKTTPNLDAFAQDAVVFENAFCSEVWTPTSHMTMFTGLYPKNHGLTRFLNIAESIDTLSETLRARGYHTGGFVGHYWWMMPSRGFAHGFDLYDAIHPYRTVFGTLERVHAWLDPRQYAPFFLFFHNYDLHSKEAGPLPYDPEDARFRTFAKDHGTLPKFQREQFPEARGSLFLAAHNGRDVVISKEEREAITDLYDDCLMKVDVAVGEFLDRLKAAGVYERALIMITADHGEALGDHDRYMHGDVYEANVHVPLLVKFPGQVHAGRRVPELVELADLYPTILDVLDVPLPGPVDGRSLLPLLGGVDESVPQVFSTRAAWRSVRTATNKLIRDVEENRMEFYAIAEDPAEANNLYEPGDIECMKLGEQLGKFFQPRGEGWHIRFAGGGKDWSVQFNAETNDRIVSAQMLHGHMFEGNMGLSVSNRFQASIRLTADVAEDTLLLRTAGTSAVVGISVSSDQPFSMGNTAEMPSATHGALVLDPMDARYATEPAPPTGDLPSVAVWFVPPSTGGAAVEALTPEAQDELRALGYVD